MRAVVSRDSVRCRRSRALRAGFSLLETVVVVGVLGLLAAIILPAVQQSRETARRISCVSNLKQIGIATHNYVDTYKVLPPSINVLYPLLPYVDQQALYDRLPTIYWPETTLSAGLASPPVYRCPSDPAARGPSMHVSYYLNSGPSNRRYDLLGFTQYDPFRGKSLATVRDGLSATAYVAEKLVPNVTTYDDDPPDEQTLPRRYTWYLWNPVDSDEQHFQMCLSPEERVTTIPVLNLSSYALYPRGHLWHYNHFLTPNAVGCMGGPPIGGYEQTTLRIAHPATSLHHGGVNVLMGDGAVRFVKDSIDLNVWRAVGTVASGDIVSDF